MKKLNGNKLKAGIQTLLNAYMADKRIFGAQILVCQKEEPVLDDCFGTADAEGTPLTKNHLFRIASMTKATTAVAVMQQAERGLIDLNAPVSEYLPAFAEMDLGHAEEDRIVIDGRAKNTLRVFHLLCHTNGIDVGAMYGILIKNHPRRLLKDTVDYYAKQPLSFEPYTAQGYSESAGFDTAARIVELVSGEPYDEYTQNRIFKPLGMTDTGYIPTKAQQERFVRMHNRREDGTAYNDKTCPGCVYEDIPYSATMAGAGLFSNAENYNRFARMLLHGGENILSADSVKVLSSSHVPEGLMPGSDRWGFGMRAVVSDDNPTGIAKDSFGWSGAYGTHFWVDPENQITAVMMRNSRFETSGAGILGMDFEKTVYASAEAESRG